MVIAMSGYFIFLLCLATPCMGSDAPRGTQDLILWPGTSAYDEKVHKLALSPEAAHNLLVSKTTAHPDHFFDRTPLFLVGDQYFFTEPRKTEIRLQGFYVNGTTGRIEYRVSDRTVNNGSREMPNDPFRSSTLVNEP